MRFKSLLSGIAALALAAVCAAPVGLAQQGQSYLQRWLFASDFGQFSIRSQTSGTYSWNPGSICNVGAVGTAPQFFAFSTTAPVEIVDLTNPALNEVVTPSTVTNTNATCAFSATFANTHYGFFVTSGTGGLQEAVNSVNSTAPYKTLIWIDRNWYALANALPSPNTPASVLAALTGNSNAVIVDNTTSPFTYYTYNGTGYSASATPGAFPNLKVSSYTQIAAPTALSTSSTTVGIITTATTGGTIPASSTYRLAATYVDASGGETLISTDTASTATIATGSGTATNTITVTSPAAATGAVGWRLYMTAASGGAGTGILYSPTCSSSVPVAQTVFPAATVCPIGSSFTVTAVVTGTATEPVTGTAYPRLAGFSGSWPPFTATTTTASAATATLGVVNVPAGYLNVLGRSIEFCGNGFATNNNTTGTIALNMTLASVPGVTSITPFTASYTTATTTAVQVPIDFCVTYTTAATGTSGTLEAHGWVTTRSATSGAGVAGQTSVDNIFAVSSAIDLTKQDQFAITITPTTTGLTAAQIRQLNVYPSN